MDSTPIIGHQRQCQQLQQERDQKKLAHAYLFTGPRHLGKFTVARWFAAEILTQGMTQVEKERSFHLMRRNIHPDLLVLDQLWIEGVCTDWNVIARSSNVAQEDRAKRRVKSDTISIDDVRDLQRRLHETPQMGKTCCLIRSMERLSMEAANALLKILEEPPSHVLICCTTESPSSLPPTILSRMRIIPFFPLTHEELSPLLTRLEAEDRSLLLHCARGAPGIILRALADSTVLLQYRLAHADALRFLEAESSVARLEQLQRALEEEESPFLAQVFLHLEEQLGGNPATSRRAHASLCSLFELLHALQSNVQRPLLAARAALQCSPPS